MSHSTRIQLLTTVLTLTILNCANAGLKIIDKPLNKGFRSKEDRLINSVIIHSAFNKSGGDEYNVNLLLRQFSRYHVSAHYLIDRKGNIYRLVSEQKVAFHAGKSKLPDGSTSVNNCSLGIELLTSFTDSPTEQQLNSLLLLVKDIKSRYNIKFVLRHSDIAPLRKTDPWNMDWDSFLSKLEL